MAQNTCIDHKEGIVDQARQELETAALIDDPDQLRNTQETMPAPLTEEVVKALDAKLPDGTLLVVRDDGDYCDGEHYRVIWKNRTAALSGMPGECWADDSDTDLMALWQYVKYGDAVYRVEDAPLLKTPTGSEDSVDVEQWGYTRADPLEIVITRDYETAIAQAAITAYEDGRPTRLYTGTGDPDTWDCRWNVTPDGDVQPA